jgi:hypothetical protein
LLKQEIVELPPQLSYTVNESLSEDAVRGNVSWPVRWGGSIRTKACTPAGRHKVIRLSIPQETPFESRKKQFFTSFFLLRQKRMRRNNLGFSFFGIAPK